MNILQSLKLGHKLTLIHKKSSAVFAIFFGLLFSSVVLLSSTTNNLYAHTKNSFEAETGGKYLAKISMCHESYRDGKCEQPEIYDEAASKAIKKYHSDLIGAVITYTSKKNDTIYVIPEKAARVLNAEPAYCADDEKIPIVTSGNFEENSDDFYVLGSYPGDGTEKYLVLDGLDKLQNYLVANNYTVDNYEPLVIFDNFEDLLDFKDTQTNVHEIFTRAIEEKGNFDKKISAVKTLFIGLLALAITTMVVMLALLFKSDEKIVSLYRSLGATKRNIACIYLITVAEIAAYVSIIALVVGNIIGTIIIG